LSLDDFGTHFHRVNSPQLLDVNLHDVNNDINAIINIIANIYSHGLSWISPRWTPLYLRSMDPLGMSLYLNHGMVVEIPSSPLYLED